MEDAVWTGVGRLIDRASSMADLRAHRLHLIAAARWRAAGHAVPERLAREEAIFVRRTFAAQRVLAAARAAYDGPMLLLKGPAVARLYPDPTRRPFSDLDILVEDPEAAQAALLAAGFVPFGPNEDDYFRGLHHLRPLALEGCEEPIVEIHRRPNWVDFADPPPARSLFAIADAEASGVPGYVALRPAEHTIAVAAHSWGDRPLRRILDLVDLKLLSAGCTEAELSAVARAWRLERVWKASVEAADAMLLGRELPLSLRTWARDTYEVRSRRVVEDHVRSWVTPFWALPPGRAAAAAVTALAHDLMPVPEETWREKYGRAREALAHPLRPLPEHKRELGPEHVRPRFKRRP